MIEQFGALALIPPGEMYPVCFGKSYDERSDLCQRCPIDMKPECREGTNRKEGS